MTRRTLIGSLSMGATALVAGYLWVSLEFPFAILLPAAAGLYAVTYGLYGAKKSLVAALVGGLSFTVAFLVAVFLALTDGSPLAIPAWLGALAAAAIAGAVTGAIIEGTRGALTLSAFAAVGMLLALVIAAALRAVAPASVDIEGPVQSAYFAVTIGLIGMAMGAFIGAGVEWANRHAIPRGKAFGGHASAV